MKRASIIFMMAVVFLISSLAITGCRDESDPEFLIEQLYDRPWRESALKNIKEMFNTAMQENNNDLENPKVKELTNVLVVGLIKAFKDFHRDPFNRKVIIELLAQMHDSRSTEVFLIGLSLESTSDSTMFNVSANAVKRQGVVAALPKLIDAYNLIIKARDRRPGTPFTTSENEIAQSIISSSQGILIKNPDASEKQAIVEMLNKITDTPDTLQELRLNMKAMKAIGKIGDSTSVPVLIRGIAMKGTRQPVSLGQIAFASLQQIHDRDAVVKGILKFSSRSDAAFNKMFAKEMKADPAMANPTWYVQQSVNFLGLLNYASPAVVKYLMAEFNHAEPDELDKSASENKGLKVNYAPEGWATMRRNWAAVALAKLGHKAILPEIKKRMVFKKEKGVNTLQIQAEEAVGYIRALGLLLYPAESCELMLEVARAGDDSMRDKTFYNASLMCGEEFMPDMKKSRDKIDCDKIIKDRFQGEATKDEEKQARNECDIMKKRIQGYMDRVTFGKKCGKKLECYTKAIADHSNQNIERAITSAYRIARDDKSKVDEVVTTLIANLGNPSKVALLASVSALDQLTPKGGDELIKKIQEVYKNFARQSTYKDRARMLEAFIGHVRNRSRK